MCGIAGFIDKKDALSSDQKKVTVRKMLDVMEHRGRDGSGIFIARKVALGHVRLSIIDTSVLADQPFIVDNNLALIYNGEIYNYQELDGLLLNKYKYKTHCDTETLIRAYQEWGLDALRKLDGMFAFALYDSVAGRLLLAVDRYSIKPLYYYNNQNFFAWASEAKALLEIPAVASEVNKDALAEFFVFRQFGGAATPWEKIKRLLPGQVVSIDLDGRFIQFLKYWDEVNAQTNSTEAGDLETILEQAVRRHLVADVPVGLQLSGGVDSSLVAILASRAQGDKFHTFSIGLSDPSWNEFTYSREVAKRISSNHHELVFTEEEFVHALPFAIYYHDEPLHHPHTVPMYLMSMEARKYVKVLLTGEGADELFGGYVRYLKVNRQSVNLDDLVKLNSFNTEDTLRLVLPGLEPLDLSYRLEVLLSSKLASPQEKIMMLDRRTYLQSLLLRQDKMGMAANLENRVPFLDNEVVSAALCMSLDDKICGQRTKSVIKDIASRYLPLDLVERKKCGFGLPVGQWLRHEFGLGRYLGLLRQDSSFVRSLSNPSALDESIAQHLNGAADNTELLWTALNLELWHRIFFKGAKPSELATYTL